MSGVFNRRAVAHPIVLTFHAEYGFRCIGVRAEWTVWNRPPGFASNVGTDIIIQLLCVALEIKLMWVKS